jgi:hypothetical protein
MSNYLPFDVLMAALHEIEDGYFFDKYDYEYWPEDDWLDLDNGHVLNLWKNDNWYNNYGATIYEVNNDGDTITDHGWCILNFGTKAESNV